MRRLHVSPPLLAFCLLLASNLNQSSSLSPVAAALTAEISPPTIRISVAFGCPKLNVNCHVNSKRCSLLSSSFNSRFPLHSPPLSFSLSLSPSSPHTEAAAAAQAVSYIRRKPTAARRKTTNSYILFPPPTPLHPFIIASFSDNHISSADSSECTSLAVCNSKSRIAWFVEI